MLITEIQLTELANDNGIKLSDFFTIVIQLIEGLADMRRDYNGPLYLNIDDILVNTANMQITRWEILRHPDDQANGQREGIYTFPELTGQTKRVEVVRTDLYLFGLVFFRLLTGTYPFDADGKSKWIYEHLKKTPTPADERRFEVPRGLSLLINKLLSNTAENRYQTIEGLEMDIRHMVNVYEQTGQVPSFPLAQTEHRASVYSLTDRLYGRDNEVARIG
jgi:hypothetical protein